MEDIDEQWISNNEHLDLNAVYIEYSPEIAMQKLKNIKELSYQERKIYTQHLSELLPIIGKDITNILRHTLKSLSEDTHDIKEILLQQIPGILKFLQGVGSYEHIKDLILHPIFDMLGSPQLDIKEKAGEILSQAAHMFTEQDRGTYILRKVLEMARDDKNEENRMVAVQLYSKLAESFGRQLCDSFVGLEFLMLGDDPQARVRKEAVINLANISRVCSPDFFKQRLLPFYLKSCQDQQWSIRKACVEIIVDLAKISDVEDKETKLTQILTEKFLEDNNKWVKVASYKCLGPFIATLKGCKLSQLLFIYYNKMTEQSVNYLSNNNEIMVACSFNFPAVLWTFGPNKWNDLKNTMITLVKSKNKDIRKPIACSLHEIAEIIGQEKAEKDLFEVYEQVLKDQSDEVKFGAIKNWAKFLQVFDGEKRENLVEVLQTVQKDPKKWRIRQLIAKQIGKLTKISSMNVIFSYIFPIATKLCNDTVSIVREEASKKMHTLVIKSQEDESFKMIIIEIIKGFSYSEKYSQRQVFVMICAKLMKHPEIFQEHFLSTFEQMATDKITNVRIIVSKVIVQHIKNEGKMAKHEKILSILDTLKKDECLEVQRQLSYVIQDGYEDQYLSQAQQPSQQQPQQLQQEQQQVEEKQKEEEQPQQQNEIQNNEQEQDTQQKQILKSQDEQVEEQDQNDIQEQKQQEEEQQEQQQAQQQQEEEQQEQKQQEESVQNNEDKEQEEQVQNTSQEENENIQEEKEQEQKEEDKQNQEQENKEQEQEQEQENGTQEQEQEQQNISNQDQQIKDQEQITENQQASDSKEQEEEQESQQQKDNDQEQPVNQEEQEQPQQNGEENSNKDGDENKDQDQTQEENGEQQKENNSKVQEQEEQEDLTN